MKFEFLRTTFNEIILLEMGWVEARNEKISTQKYIPCDWVGRQVTPALKNV